MPTGRCSVSDSLRHSADSEMGRAARMASLPVDILADPDAVDDGGSIPLHDRDVVRPERLASSRSVVVGWGERAWRATLVRSDAGISLSPPEPEELTWAPSPAEWHSRAHKVLDGHWARGTDDATQARLIAQLLELPLHDLRRESRSLRLLLSAHRSLRHAARRVLLQTVAQHHLGVEAPPHTIAVWHVLARLTRTPAARLAGATQRGVLRHDLQPQCPTARRLSDG